jgi:hypothetical protein
VEQTPAARVYDTGSVVGCARGRGKAVRLGESDYGCLGSSSGCGGVWPVSLSATGTFVAYGDFQSGGAYFDAFYTLMVQDLRTGRVRYRIDQGEIAKLNAYLERIVVDGHGRAAWIWRSQTPPYGPSHLELWRMPACGPQGIATDADLRLSGFRLSRGVLSWRVGRETRHAPLCPALPP